MGGSQSDLELADEWQQADEAEVDVGFERRERALAMADHGLRLDKLLTLLAPEFSRNHLQGLVEAGHVRVDGVTSSTSSRKLKAGQTVVVTLVPPAESLAFTPQAMNLDVVYEDAHLLVVNKPAGLVVHPAAGNWSGTLLNGLLARDPAAAQLPRAGIVHRLDKDTSGLMVVGRSLQAVTALMRDIAARTVKRRYMALAHGDVGRADFTVDGPVGRDPAVRVRMAVIPQGKPARTDVMPVAYRDGVSAVRCALHTGRTHQIRVHLAHQGHPLVADAVYGGRHLLGMTRQALHAVELGFAHPVGGEMLAFECPPPDDFASAWAAVAIG
ncbi:MAG: RluA family pseudouridine synthase [Vitreoscilla sp.]|nr:RluA family pseudouridine synthase [Vitreoscilla sp.]MBP6673714.1 RluA family pseudouridine synthase [Vitreoscilla sp.]